MAVGCRAPDEYRVDYGQTDGTLSSGRTRDFSTDSDTMSLGVSWDAGDRRSQRTETLARLDALSHHQRPPPVEPEAPPLTHAEIDAAEAPHDPLGLQEGLIGGSGLALVLMAFFRDAVGLFFRRMLRMKGPE